LGCLVRAKTKKTNFKNEFSKYPLMINMVQYRHLFLLFVLIGNLDIVFSQKNDTTKVASDFGGSVTITSKGISTIPNLTLGKPAAIFAMFVGRKIRFEPEFRFALEGKPWTFIFWWRYDMINSDRFYIRAGVNTSINFKTITATTNEFSDDILWARRSLTGDMTASYFLAKNINIGAYHMYIHNFEKNTTINTHLFSLRTGFSDIKLSKSIFVKLNSQVYYLKMDKDDGFYFNATLAFAKRDFPLSVSSLINKAIHTDIPVGENFVWNVSLIYTFNKKYIEQN
jgi:hypothetical protein